MLKREKYPVIEFDDCREAVINPSLLQSEYGVLPYNKLVISFFGEAIRILLDEGKIREYITVSGENPVVIYKFADADVLITHGMVGCPACAGNLDCLTGIGIDTVMFCGGGGSLDGKMEVGLTERSGMRAFHITISSLQVSFTQMRMSQARYVSI